MKVYIVYRSINGRFLSPEAVFSTEEKALDYINVTGIDLMTMASKELFLALDPKFLYKELIVQ